MSLREIDACDSLRTCNNLKKQVCPLCDGDRCDVHMSGLIKTINLLSTPQSRLRRQELPFVDNIAFCSDCSEMLDKIDASEISKIDAEDFVSKLRIATAKRRLVGEQK